MVATGKDPSVNSDDKPHYETRCIVSTCNKPILQEDSSDTVCASCRQAAKKATTKLKARRLKSYKSESGLWTPKSETSTQSGSGIDMIKCQIFSPVPAMTEPNDRGKKRKVAADEIENWRNLKSQKIGEVPRGSAERDFTGQRSQPGTVGRQEVLISSDPVENLPQLSTRAESVVISPSTVARKTGIVPPISIITRSRNVRNSEAAESISPDIQFLHSKPCFSDGSIPLPKPRDEADKSAGNPPLPVTVLPIPVGSLPASEGLLSMPEGSQVPEWSLAPLDDEVHAPTDDDVSPFAPERSPIPEESLTPLEDDVLSLTDDDDPLFAPLRAQHATNNISTFGTNRSPEGMYEDTGDQLTESSYMLRGISVPSTPESTSPADTTLKQPPKTPVIFSNSQHFTDNGIVKFQPFVPFIGASLDSIEPTLNPNSVQARRFKNPLGIEANSLGFYDMLSKYSNSDEDFMARTLFDLRTDEELYITIQAKIATRGGRKGQFGEVCSRLDVDPTWSKHQNQPWKTNPAALNRDDLPLQKILGEFDAKDMVPMVIEGELHLSQHEEYEGPRRTWRYGDGGAGKDQGYLEAQAGAWAHLAKAAI
ncbi:hypothetical protein V496_03634 [Pseudogymnoascus sp. VKM F-4515 (FW-2607)]|nr:hypothetical protein V496_03634 [Pseudogymnoascus sp. VKM F-4515 (FW-2607)]KFY95593.1 hypothetical protein V498_03272 [Pseudogymnoascus sp. VKM F-4517 (FW-2822)]